MKKNDSVKHYFVDEAGDAVLFSRKGQVLVGKQGCSRFFMLGLLDIADPDSLHRFLGELRQRLLSDPYFGGVPSMQPEAKKTAIAFHAKDDLPEVRREVMTLLKNTPGLRFFAVVTDKWRVLDYVRHRNEREEEYRYHQNELYDYLVRRLFRDRLHKDDEYRIYFAKRGSSDRTAALRMALQQARRQFYERWGISSDAPFHVLPSTPPQQGGLQAVDYCFWALQRLYERGEDRYVRYLWSSFRLVQDIDDCRESRYGIYYTRKRPLTAEALEGRTDYTP